MCCRSTEGVDSRKRRKDEKGQIGKLPLRSVILGAIQEVASDYIHIARCSRHRVQL